MKIRRRKNKGNRGRSGTLGEVGDKIFEPGRRMMTTGGVSQRGRGINGRSKRRTGGKGR